MYKSLQLYTISNLRKCDLIECFYFVTVEKDLLLLGMISSQMNTGRMTASSKRKHQKVRVNKRTTYMFESFTICRETFMFVNG